MNYFDSLAASRALPAFQNPLAISTGISLYRDDANQQANQAADTFADQQSDMQANPFVGPIDEPMQVQPQQTIPQPEANPFVGPIDQPARQNPFAGPAAQQPVAPPLVPAASNNQVEYNPVEAARFEKVRADVSTLVNNGATREQIAARLEQDGLGLASLTGLEEALAHRAQHSDSLIPVGIRTPEAPKAEKSFGPDQGAWNAVRLGAQDGVTLGLSDEGGAAVGAIGNLVAGMFGGGTGEDFGDYYARNRDDNRQAMADAREYHPYAYLGGQAVGGLVTAPIGGGAATLARGGMAAAGRLALEGAALGGAYGFNSGTGDLSDRLREGRDGALMGAAGGVLIGSPLNAVTRRIAANRSAPSQGREMLDSARNLNQNLGLAGQQRIRPLPGQISDRGILATGQAMLAPSLVGGKNIVSGLGRAVTNFSDNVEGAAGVIANREAGGMAQDLTTVAARANDPNVPGSLAAYAGDTESAARSVYQAAESAAGDARVPTPAVIGRIDEILEEWRAVPGGVPGLETLANLRATLARGPSAGTTSAAWTVEGLRRLRTSFGENIESNQRQLREAANRLWTPLYDDIFRGLRMAGRPDAARLYREADRQWARRADGIEVINRVIGRNSDLSADAVASNLSTMSTRDYDHLGTALQQIDPAQAGAIRGALINRFGEQIASRATRPGEFSLESFSTRWLKMSDQAKAAMFSTAAVRDLNDLSRLAGGQRQVNQLGNPSRSGITVQNWRETGQLTNVASGFALSSALGPGGVALLATAGAGRLLASPVVARALVSLSESRTTRAVAQLTDAARRNPAMAQEIFRLRDTITENGNPTISTPEAGNQPDMAANPFVGPVAIEQTRSIESAPVEAAQPQDTRIPLPDQPFTLD